MPFCNNCGAEIKEEQKFCMECGINLESGQIPEPEQEDKKSVVQIDKEELEKTMEKSVDSARKGLGAAWRLAQKGVKKGAEMTSKGIEAARDTIEERRSKEETTKPEDAPKQLCPSCSEEINKGTKFCNHCGAKLE